MRWYLSGKITGDDDYRIKFEKAEKLLTQKGYKVLNPISMKRTVKAGYTT